MANNIEEKLEDLGPRPSPRAVEQAKEALAVIDAHLSSQLESISLYGGQQKSQIARLQDSAEQEKLPYKTVLWLDQLYKSYEVMMSTKHGDAKLLDSDHHELEGAGPDESMEKSEDKNFYAKRKSDDGVLNLSGLQLTRLVDDSSKLCSLVALDLSKNNLEILPDYFDNLCKLRVLNVSGNMLKSLPDSISRCSSLLELDASFNQLEYLASNFGSGLRSLQRLFLQLNKLAALPLSVTNLTTLVHLEVQFNKLVTLPLTIGSLKNLRRLNASGNFSNLTTLPDSIGYASSLTYLDLSYNQISKLPLSFAHLTQLQELKLLQNPLVVPPMEVVEHSTKAVVEYMSELLRNSQTTPQDVDNPRRGSSGSSTTAAAAPVFKSVSSKSMLKSSWFGELLGGMCRSTSLVLGGSAAKFVVMGDDRSSDSE